MSVVLCLVVLQIITIDGPSRWVGQMTGLEVNAKRDKLLVDFTRSIEGAHLKVAFGQPTAFFVNENSCNYVTIPVVGEDETTTEAGLK